MVTVLLIALAAGPGVRGDSAPSEADAVVQQAFAAEPASPSSSPARPAEAPTGRFFGWGLAVAAIAAVAAMALKRRGQRESAGFAEVAQNLSVGPKRSLLVVCFGGKRMLVGSTETGFSVLASEPLPAQPTAFDATLEAQLEQWAAQTAAQPENPA